VWSSEVLAAGHEAAAKVDCGVNALYILMALEGRAVTLDQLTEALPPRHPEGYSMAELSTAAASFGLGLDGIQFSKGDKALSHPAITFLKDGRGGHFAVLRPVGATGTMAQILDPPGVPWIGDYERIMSTKAWTGRVLLSRDPWLSRTALPFVLASAGLAVLALSRVRIPASENSTQSSGS